ncbi:MalY/PatB family protein [Alicyclobacillus tolerans]|uniref:MalY/PatB family protein n=1 Tax=Alicyclobacillus tolerans TaxID=90970 RepID=UPI003B786C66
MTYSFDEIIPRRHTASSKWDTLQKRFGRDDILPLWVADMDFLSPPEVQQALMERVKHGVYGYAIRPDSLYESIQNWFAKRHQVHYQQDWILPSRGVVHGLAMGIRAWTEPGDGIVIQPPVYYPFQFVIERQGRKLLENPLIEHQGKYTMDFDHLRSLFSKERPKWLILCNPHNPVGRVWSKDELLTLAKLCDEYDVHVLADEIHCDFVYKPHQHLPMLNVYEPFIHRLAICIAPSKTFNLAGMYTAFIVIPDENLRQRYSIVLEETFVQDADIFGPIACEAAYRHGASWLDELLIYLQENYRFMEGFFQRELPSLKISPLEGTYLTWVDFRETHLSDDELQKWLVDQARVGLNAGSMFGTGGAGFQRMNIGTPRPLLAEALVQLKEAWPPV